MWVRSTPQEMSTETLAGFPDRFEWALDDLRALVSSHPIIAEGWGLRPELVARIIDSPRRMVVMVPTPGFRQYQFSELPRTASLRHRVSDPVRAQANRLSRDRLVAEDATRTAHQLGIRVIEVGWFPRCRYDRGDRRRPLQPLPPATTPRGLIITGIHLKGTVSWENTDPGVLVPAR